MASIIDSDDNDDTLNQLISRLETIEIEDLKHVSYKKYLNKLLAVSRRALLVDGARLSIIIQQIKSYTEPSFQRNVLLDLLEQILSNCLLKILEKPLVRTSSAQWNDLACGITTIPDLFANCNALEKYPHLRKEPYYNRLVEQVYVAIEHRSDTGSSGDPAYRLFLLKLLGRVALAGFGLVVWKKFTLRTIYESRCEVKQLCCDIFQSAIKPPSELTSLEIFIDHLCLPIFSNLKPSCDSGQLIKSILGRGLEDSEHLRYLICDKSLFKTNYNLAREKQAIILFNIAAYLSSLVIRGEEIPELKSVNNEDSVNLLTKTFLEIVHSWTNPTKILIRTYQHSKYITCALLVFYRYAARYDNKCLAELTLKIQSMIINSLPIYLNRASQEQRDLACCLCKLILPKLRDTIVTKNQTPIENEELKIDFKVCLDDDLLYLHRLFDHDVEVLFQDIGDDTRMIKCEADSKAVINTECTAGVEESDQVNSCQQLNDKQPRVKTNDLNNDKVASRHSLSQVSTDGASLEREYAAQVHRDEGEDLIPYNMSESDDPSDEDEFELAGDATNVPIYLRDCINGLIDNSNRRYVHLCLIKANALTNDLINQNVADDTQMTKSVYLAARPVGDPSCSLSSFTGGQHIDDNYDNWKRTTSQYGVNDTIKDAGVELTRTLLFMENQYNIEKFDEYRLNCLVSLCFAAPDLVGKYLIDELNETNRSMRQQLDILNILVETAHRLSNNMPKSNDPGSGHANGIKKKQNKITSKEARKSINKFASHASLFFYGISHRLKADFLDTKSLVVSQPEGIMSAFRTRREIDDKMTFGVPRITLNLDGSRMGKNSARQSMKLARPVVEEEEEDADGEKCKKDDIQYQGEDDQTERNKLLERHSISDDSYLLSRILLSISNILSCSAQQPVTCKLSSDLLDILSAYRCHPDSGVQHAIVSCLKMIRDCTPGTYYGRYIEKRMSHSFGPWLAKNESNFQR